MGALPLMEELVPFLITRSGQPFDAFARWVKTRRPIPWLMRMLESIPMSNAAYDEMMLHLFEKTDDPGMRARQRKLAEKTLEFFPEAREMIREEAEMREARIAVREVLEARALPLSAEEAARIDACTSLETLHRWHKQAVVAPTTAEALR